MDSARRSTQSATHPPTRVSARKGRASASPTSPSDSGSPVARTPATRGPRSAPASRRRPCPSTPGTPGTPGTGARRTRRGSPPSPASSPPFRSTRETGRVLRVPPGPPVAGCTAVAGCKLSQKAPSEPPVAAIATLIARGSRPSRRRRGRRSDPRNPRSHERLQGVRRGQGRRPAGPPGSDPRPHRPERRGEDDGLDLLTKFLVPSAGRNPVRGPRHHGRASRADRPAGSSARSRCRPSSRT